MRLEAPPVPWKHAMPNDHKFPRTKAANGRPRFCLFALMGASLLCLGVAANAQIVQPGGTSSQEKQASPAQTSAGGGTPVMQESLKPQTRPEGGGAASSKAPKHSKAAAGNGGFENGLYGTGAGSNK